MSSPSVFVAMPNDTERALVVAELTEAGLDARGIKSLSILFAQLASRDKPLGGVVLDSALGLSEDKLRAMKSLAPDAEIIVITGAFDANVAATRVLRRPFTIGELESTIKELTGNK